MTTTAPSLAEWLAERPFTLALSSGFFGFFAHLGVLRALRANRLQPARYVGSSAGALVGGCMAAGCAPEQLHDTLMALQREHFWDPAPGLGLLAGQRFRGLLGGLLPQQQVELCPVPVALSAWHGASRRTRVLVEGDLVEAIYASCAVPLLFQPARINGGWYWDGGIGDRPGLAATRPGERVFYHHLASRSPWRRRNSPALQIPRRPNLVAMTLQQLPRSGPGKLEQGRRALDMAYHATLRALAMPVHEGLVRL
ncbi:MAG: patatin-like phospholipase family protein [Alcanivorax sp.]|nr:patatin-like phospholipase family protein [Alcanivorax sp.]